MLSDVQPVIIVSTERLSERLPASGPMCCAWTPNDDAGNCRRKRNAICRVKPRGTILAYVMYTSGSTGRPKGVVRDPSRRSSGWLTATDYVALSPRETLLQLAPLTFDASTFEIWGALLNGGRLVIMPPGDADAWRNWARRCVATASRRCG